MKAEQLFDVQGLVAVVVGEADGLGPLIARTLAENGALVTIINPDVEAKLTTGGKAIGALATDIRDPSTLEGAMARVISIHGVVDALFICSGRLPDEAADKNEAVETLPLVTWTNRVDDTLNRAFHAIRAVVPTMKKQRHGVIIICTPNLAGGSVSEIADLSMGAALVHMVSHLARELAPFGIRLNALRPTCGLQTAVPEAYLREAEGQGVAGLVLFFASGASSFVTGANYVFHGFDPAVSAS